MLILVAELAGDVLRIFLELASEGSVKDALNEFGTSCVMGVRVSGIRVSGSGIMDYVSSNI